MSIPDYIVVQAGGKGTRLGKLTKNKPKALVSIDNLPMIFHLFQRFSDCKFVVITDYLGDVFNRYLEAFCNAKYVSVSANGTGTSSGIKKAMSFIPDNTPFMLIWSDLILGDDFKYPENPGNYVGLSESFECRWSYCEGRFLEEASVDSGVAGLFIFRDKSFFKNVPESGEFVRWLSESEIIFDAIGIGATRQVQNTG